MGTDWSYIKQIKASFIFYWEPGIAVHAIKGSKASSLAEGEVSLFFSCGSVNLGFIFNLRRGRPFKIRNFSATPGLLSSYDGYNRNLN